MQRLFSAPFIITELMHSINIDPSYSDIDLLDEMAGLDLLLPLISSAVPASRSPSELSF